MSVGKYSFMDYVRVGLPLQVIVIAAMVWLLPLFYPPINDIGKNRRSLKSGDFSYLYRYEY